MESFVEIVKTQPEYTLAVIVFLGIIVLVLVWMSDKTAKIIKALLGKEETEKKEETKPAATNPPQQPLAVPVPVSLLSVQSSVNTSATTDSKGYISIDERSKNIIQTIEQHKSLHMIDILLDGLQEPTFFMDYDGIVRCWNRWMDDITGYSHSEIVGSNIVSLMPPPHNKLHGSYIQTYLKGISEENKIRVVGKARNVEILHKDGHLLKCTLRITHVENGICGFMASVKIPLNSAQKIPAYSSIPEDY